MRQGGRGSGGSVGVRLCHLEAVRPRDGEAKGWWEGEVSARDGGRGMRARGGRKEGHDFKGR